MILSESRSLDWIIQVGKENNIHDLTLLEKTIRAFCLLEALARSGCPFLFKGGSALMLQLDCTQRLSIDIDIVCPPGTDVIKYLEIYAEEYGFGEIKPVERLSRNNVPKTHAKCFYQVSYVTNAERGEILLDVLFEDCWYSNIESLPIKSRFLKMSGEDIFVKIPSKEDLLGDKLTAFAPNTTGIPYIKMVINKRGEMEERHCSMEIIKQLFDVASLFDSIGEDLSIVRNTFQKIAPIELEYRKMAPDNLTAVFDDIYHTSEIICTNVYSKDGSFESSELSKGISQIHDLIISENYTYYSAAVNASKAAYLATLLKYGINEINRYSPSIDLSQLRLFPTVNPSINKIKSIRPEAFFYWYEISRLLQQNK
ncbi:MAG: nucleotidyl transferase AbiEii/AbiGii toxin family protein [Candidatus Cryptobacteroides sp.]|jgi:hypothetical protein